MKSFLFLCILVVAFSCSENKEKATVDSFQTMSFEGDSLFIPTKTQATEEKLLADIEEAESAYEADPSEMATIWLGRRWAYYGDYLRAISIYSAGLEDYPSSYKLYRHRGHRYVSLRMLDKAIADFEKAYELMPKGTLEIEPDGIPNKINQPLSNTQFNILYHWGLALYLKEDYEGAEKVYKECLAYSDNDDLITATADWLYMTQRRLARNNEGEQTLALISKEMDIIENASYHKRLLMYKGLLPVDSLFKGSDNLSLITQGYGIGNWYLYNNDTTKALQIFEDVLANESWSPFGYIAAERDHAILNK